MALAAGVPEMLTIGALVSAAAIGLLVTSLPPHPVSERQASKGRLTAVISLKIDPSIEKDCDGAGQCNVYALGRFILYFRHLRHFLRAMSRYECLLYTTES